MNQKSKWGLRVEQVKERKSRKGKSSQLYAKTIDSECQCLPEGDLCFFRFDMRLTEAQMNEHFITTLYYSRKRTVSVFFKPALASVSRRIEDSEDGKSKYYRFTQYTIQIENDVAEDGLRKVMVHVGLADNMYINSEIEKGVCKWELEDDEGIMLSYCFGQRSITLPFTDPFYEYKNRSSQSYAQRKPLWYKFRKGRIGGSSLGGWLGLFRSYKPNHPKFKSKLHEAYERLNGRGVPLAASRAIRLGRIHEIDVITSCLAFFNTWTIEEAGWISHEKISYAGGSPDGLIFDTEMNFDRFPKTVQQDIRAYEKETGTKADLRYGVFEAKVSEKEDKMPYYYIPQLQLVMETTNRWWSVLVRHHLKSGRVMVYYVFRDRHLWSLMRGIVEDLFAIIEMNGGRADWPKSEVPFPDDIEVVENCMKGIAEKLNGQYARKEGLQLSIPYAGMEECVEMQRRRHAESNAQEVELIDVEPVDDRMKQLIMDYVENNVLRRYKKKKDIKPTQSYEDNSDFSLNTDISEDEADQPKSNKASDNDNQQNGDDEELTEPPSPDTKPKKKPVVAAPTVLQKRKRTGWLCTEFDGKHEDNDDDDVDLTLDSPPPAKRRKTTKSGSNPTHIVSERSDKKRKRDAMDDDTEEPESKRAKINKNELTRKKGENDEKYKSEENNSVNFYNVMENMQQSREILMRACDSILNGSSGSNNHTSGCFDMLKSLVTRDMTNLARLLVFIDNLN